MTTKRVLCFVTAAMAAIAINTDTFAKNVGGEKSVLVAHAKAAIREQLRDPESARFKISKFAGVDGSIVCGTVNAKNGYGGYAGPLQFVYQDDDHHGHPQMAVIIGSSEDIRREGLTENTIQQIVAKAVCDSVSNEK